MVFHPLLGAVWIPVLPLAGGGLRAQVHVGQIRRNSRATPFVWLLTLGKRRSVWIIERVCGPVVRQHLGMV